MPKKKSQQSPKNFTLEDAFLVGLPTFMLMEAEASVALDNDPDCHTCGWSCTASPLCPGNLPCEECHTVIPREHKMDCGRNPDRGITLTANLARTRGNMTEEELEKIRNCPTT